MIPAAFFVFSCNLSVFCLQPFLFFLAAFLYFVYSLFCFFLQSFCVLSTAFFVFSYSLSVFCLQLSLFSEVTVFESKEVQNAVKPDVVDALFGIGCHSGFGMEGDAQSGFGNHG